MMFLGYVESGMPIGPVMMKSKLICLITVGYAMHTVVSSITVEDFKSPATVVKRVWEGRGPPKIESFALPFSTNNLQIKAQKIFVFLAQRHPSALKINNQL